MGLDSRLRPQIHEQEQQQQQQQKSKRDRIYVRGTVNDILRVSFLLFHFQIDWNPKVSLYKIHISRKKIKKNTERGRVLSAKSSPIQKYLLVPPPSCVLTSPAQLTVYLFFFFLKLTKLKVKALLYLSNSAPTKHLCSLVLSTHCLRPYFAYFFQYRLEFVPFYCLFCFFFPNILSFTSTL